MQIYSGSFALVSFDDLIDVETYICVCVDTVSVAVTLRC